MATRADRIVLDLDSSESPVHEAQEGSAYDGHCESVCCHPLLLFSEHGDCLGATLRPGDVYSAEDWDDLLLPEIAELSPRTFCTFAREFSPVRQQGPTDGSATLNPETVSACLLVPAQSDRPGSRLRTNAVGSRGSRSAGSGHAAASLDGHVSQNADRLSSRRDRRATIARDIRSAGTASPIPKYISSGVWPRNAECGSTRLCSWT